MSDDGFRRSARLKAQEKKTCVTRRGVQNDAEKQAALLKRIREIYPNATQISIKASATGQGVDCKWTYDSDSDASNAAVKSLSVSSSAESSLTTLSESSSESSKSAYTPSVLSRSSSTTIESSLSSLSSDVSLPRIDATPRQVVHYIPGTVLRTPRKPFLGRNPVRAGPNLPIDWTAEHSPEEIRPRGRRPYPAPVHGSPLARRRRLSPIQEQPSVLDVPRSREATPAVRADTLEPERRRRQRLQETRSYHERMGILEAHSQVLQSALQATQESGSFDEDADGNNLNDMEEEHPVAGPSRLPDPIPGPSRNNHAPLLSSVPDTPDPESLQVISEVLLQLPGTGPSESCARFYRDPKGRWQLEGPLDTEVLNNISLNHEEMIEDSAFKISCQEWAWLHQHHPASSTARVKAPLSEEDVQAMVAEAAIVAARGLPPPQQHAETDFQEEAGPSQLHREDTEIIGVEVPSRRVSQVTFPGGRRVY
ncbi:hypothetical protein EUX98_g9119 [Antrodiella citrinella]|uniref:Uncharacterized protein n=1 Tax=Antrodiella citrinella TaxID=2447956 RepID=A0A4S4LY64_9APHY|nr:hypothetical protein EUX98_g9119 [Antrodiella citrinella]